MNELAQVQVFYQLFAAIVVSGAATAIAVEVMKSRYIPVPAQRFPRLTALVISVGASIFAIVNSPVAKIAVDTPIEYAAVAIGTLLVSAVTYNSVIKGGSKIGQ